MITMSFKAAVHHAEVLCAEDQDRLAEMMETEAKRLAVLRGREDSDAGRIIPGEQVEAWLASWGTDHEQPAPLCK